MKTHDLEKASPGWGSFAYPGIGTPVQGISNLDQKANSQTNFSMHIILQ
jgi:hypothetical protein